MAVIDVRVRDGVTIVRFRDASLTEESRVRDIGAELLKLSEQGDVTQLLLNSDGVAFMASVMLGQLAILWRRCQSRRVSLRLCCVPDSIREVLRIVRLDTLAEICGEEEDALNAFRFERQAARPASRGGASPESADLYRAAAEQGDAQAQFRLGRCYDNGSGVAQDFTRARELYERSARQGYAEAQYALATCHAFGIHVAQNYDEAVKWYRMAADQGHVEAQYAVGMNYNYGLSGPADLAEAANWYRKAAAQGHVKAAEALGILASE